MANPDQSLPVLGNDTNQCLMCRHLTDVGEHPSLGSRGWRCAAFPDQDIPFPIVKGVYDHREPWVLNGGDKGIQFEDKPDAEIKFEDLAGPVDNEWLSDVP